MSKMPWFRAYTEMIDDEKLRLLAFEDRWHFMALLCLKGQGVLDSDDPNDPLMVRKVAVKMGIDLRTLEEVVRRLSEVGLIDRHTFQPLAWNARQMRSDSDPSNAARQRRHRERKKRDVALRNATITALEEDTDIDTEEENNIDPNDIEVPVAWKASLGDDAIKTAFETFWKAGMVKTGKKTSLARFRSIVRKDALDPGEFAQTLADDVRARIAAKQFGFDKLHPTTYLNQERWDDEVVPYVPDKAGRPSINDFSDNEGDPSAGMRTSL